MELLYSFTTVVMYNFFMNFKEQNKQKIKNQYMELNVTGKIEMQNAESRNLETLHNAFKTLPGYEKIDNHTIYLKINNKKTRVTIFRIVPEGMDHNKAKSEKAKERVLYQKRVQVKKSDVKLLPDAIICTYINGGLVIYSGVGNINSLSDLPETGNPTTLFRIDVRFMKNVLNGGSVKTTLISRQKPSEVIFSTDINDIFEYKFQQEIDSETYNFGDEEEFIVFDDEVDEQDHPDEFVGRAGEEIVYELIQSKSELLSTINDFHEYNWVNQFKEKFMPYDFEKGNDVLEVKASRNDFGSFILSANEHKKLMENPSAYNLIKLSGVNAEDKTFQKLVVYTGDEVLNMEYNTIVSYVMKEK